MKTLINVVLVILFFLEKIVDGNIPVIVHSQYGDVLGYQSDLARVFYGIPFAKPPIGSLRYFVLDEIFAY